MGLFLSAADPPSAASAAATAQAATARAVAALCAIVQRHPAEAEAEPSVHSVLMLNGSWMTATIDPSAEDQQQHVILQGSAVHAHSPVMALALDPGYLSVTDGVAEHLKAKGTTLSAHALSLASHPKMRDAQHFTHRLKLSELRTSSAVPDARAGCGAAAPRADGAAASEMLLPRSVLRWLEGGAKQAKQWVELRAPTAVLVAHVSHRPGVDAAWPAARCVHACLAKEGGWVHSVLTEPSHTLVVGCFEGNVEGALKVRYPVVLRPAPRSS